MAGALAHLERHRAEVNDLNVFPVADGDTGDNVAQTVRAVLHGIDTAVASAGEPLARTAARAALLGARGNSGVILSQLVAGAAESDPFTVPDALRRAADRAACALPDPVEGTMLTVARDMADAAAGAGATTEALERALDAGRASVLRGPELLPALREAGVVDAGGHALTLLLAGALGVLRGDAPRDLPVTRPAAVAHASPTHRWCTNVVVEGADLEPDAWTAALEGLGDSVLVVGDATALRAHLHTDDPDGAVALLARAGRIADVQATDMRAQVADRAARSGARRTAVRALVAGEGLLELFASLGLEGEAPETLLLAAPGLPVPTGADAVVHGPAQALLAAAVAVDPARGAAENARAVTEALGHIATAALPPGSTPADLRRTLGDLARRAELLTVLTGAGAPELPIEAPPGVELQVEHGGQPDAWWLIAAE